MRVNILFFLRMNLKGASSLNGTWYVASREEHVQDLAYGEKKVIIPPPRKRITLKKKKKRKNKTHKKNHSSLQDEL